MVASAAIPSSDLRPPIVSPTLCSPHGSPAPLDGKPGWPPSERDRRATTTRRPLRGTPPSAGQALVTPTASLIWSMASGLARAHDLVVLPVGVRDLVRDGQDEAPVPVELLGRGLALDECDRGAQTLHALVPERLRRSTWGVPPWLGGHDLVQQLALPVPGPRLRVGLGHRERLPERCPAGRRDDDHACGRGAGEHSGPLIRRESVSCRHRCSSSGRRISEEPPGGRRGTVITPGEGYVLDEASVP